MKIGILGCGWLGLPLAESLIQKGYNINGSTTRKERLLLLKEVGINAFEILITEDKIEGNIKEFLECDILIIDFPPKRRENVVDQYPKQIERLKNEILKSSVKKVVFIGSTSVYPNSNEVVNESTKLDPVRNSGKALIDAEQIITSDLDSYETTIIRFSGLIGPYRNPGRFLAGKSNLSGAASPVNLIHLDDCIALIEAILEENKWGLIFNGASPDHPMKKDYYTLAAKKMNLPPPEFDQDETSDYKVVDGSKAEKLMKFRYKHRDLKESLKEM